MGSLRSHELSDLQQRMAASMQRIADLEIALSRASGPGTALNPAGAARADDTHVVVRDARPSRKTPRVAMSPRGGAARSPSGNDPSIFNDSAATTMKLRTRQVLDDASEPGLIGVGLARAGSGLDGVAKAAAVAEGLLHALGGQILTPAQVCIKRTESLAKHTAQVLHCHMHSSVMQAFAAITCYL